MKHSQHQHFNHHLTQHPDYKKIFSKSNASKKETIYKRCCCPIEDLGFSPWIKSNFTKQCLQQDHYQVQPMEARPWTFTLEIATRYSKSTTKNKCSPHMCFHPLLPRLLLQVIKHPTQRKNMCKSSSQPIHLSIIANLRSRTPYLSPPLSISWKYILRHVPWHRQEREATLHALMNPHWLKIRARKARAISI
jgi:hypothetical protein